MQVSREHLAVIIAALSLFGFGGIFAWLFTQYAQPWFQRRNARRDFLESLAAFMEKSRIPGTLWEEPKADMGLRKIVAINYLQPLYKDFLSRLVQRPSLDALRIDPLSPEEVRRGAGTSIQTLLQAERRMVAHLAHYLAVFERANKDDAEADSSLEWLFTSSGKEFDYPGRYWFRLLLQEGIRKKPKKHKQQHESSSEGRPPRVSSPAAQSGTKS